MTSATPDAAGSGLLAEETDGPLEQRHLRYANYCAVADGSRVTRTHWPIALANGLGWDFDGMDGVIFGLISPLVIKEFALTIRPTGPASKSGSPSASRGFICGRGSPTGSAAARCSPSTSRSSR